MRKLITPGRLLALGGLLALVTLGILWLAPSDDYLLLPDEAHPVAPLVTVARPKQGGGTDGIYFVDVIQRRASIIESLFPELRDGATLVSGEQVNPHGISDGIRRAADLRQMAHSQEIAAAVAMERLGYDVDVRADGALVVGVFEKLPAEGKVRAGDVIVAIDGKPVRTTADLQRLVSSREPGEPVDLTLRNGKPRTVRLVTAANPEDTSRAVIGVLVEQAAKIGLPFEVKIDTGEIGGPSAGLAFALALMEKLGKDVDRGHRVAATGELALDGTVGSIGGIKQKTLGARQAGVDVFLVPVENATEARRNGDGLRIVAVRTFRDALRFLATLPKKPPQS